MEAVSKIQTNSAESHKAGNNVDKQASPEAPKDATALPTNQSPIAPDPLKTSITTTPTTTSNTTTPPATLSNNTTKVLNLSGELYTKHPLEHVWVLWYFKQVVTSNYPSTSHQPTTQLPTPTNHQFQTSDSSTSDHSTIRKRAKSG